MGKPRFNAASLKHKEDHILLPEHLIIDETLNGRFEPHSEQKVVERAIDMLQNGQLQPIGIRKAHANEGKPQVVFGFLRAKAALYINKVLLPNGGVKVGDEFIEVTTPFQIHAVASEGNDLDSFKKNIIENLSRENTTVMDMAKNQNELRKRNMSEEDIAKMYKMTVEGVKRNAKLLSLPANVQLMIHRGIISGDAGLELLTVNEDKQKEILGGMLAEAEQAGQIKFEHSEQAWMRHLPGSESVNEQFGAGFSEGKDTGKKNGKKRAVIGTSKIKNAVRKAKEEKGQKGSPRNMSDFRKFVTSFVGPDSDKPEPIKEFCKKVLAFLRGDITEKQMENAMVKLHEAEPVEA